MIQALLPLLTTVGSGALSGISSKLGMSKEKKQEPLMTPEQKSQARASQALIPFYLQMMSGGMPDYLKRYLAQTQGALSQQTRQGISEYMRKIGGAGMDFGPQQAAQLGQMMQGITPALMQGLTQSRLGLTQGAMKGMQQWSTQQVPWAKPPDKQPSFGQAAGAGALGSIGSFLGGMKTGGSPNAGGTKYPGAPYSQQYMSSLPSNIYADVMGKMAPNVPPSMYPLAMQNINPSGFTDMSGGGNYGPAIYPGKK